MYWRRVFHGAEAGDEADGLLWVRFVCSSFGFILSVEEDY